MRLYDEIFKSVDGVAVARCLLVPGGEGYLEGVKSVEEFSPERLVICFSKNRVEIEGEGLSISITCARSAVLPACLHFFALFLLFFDFFRKLRLTSR